MSSDKVRFFEIPLESFNGKIPFIVVDLIEEMRRRHVENIQGIFRLNGSDSRVKEIIERYNNGPISSFAEYKDINDLSTTLKRYFRYMTFEKRPLIPFELYDCFIGLMNYGDEEKTNEVMKGLLKNLNQAKYKTLGYLIKFLNDISKNQSVNNMTAMNLAICITPNILVAPETNQSLMKESGLANQVIELMIKNYDQIFDELVITKDDFCTDEDIATLWVPKLDLELIKQLTIRCKLREESLIPYVPMCRVLCSKKIYQRPNKPLPVFDDKEEEEDANDNNDNCFDFLNEKNST